MTFTKNFFSTSNPNDANYPKDSKFFDETNKKVIGKMKDEFEGKIVAEISIKKVFSIKKIDGKKCKTAKRVSVATEFIKFKDFSFNKKIMRDKMRRIETKPIKIGTYGIKAKCLSVFNDKISVSDDGIHTQAYFHKDLKKTSHKNAKNAKDFHREKRFKKSSHKKRDFHR